MSRDEAIEMMARAIGEDTYAGNAKRTEEGMFWLRRYAKAALAALLPSPEKEPTE